MCLVTWVGVGVTGPTNDPMGPAGDTLGIRLPVDFAILYQIMQSTSSTESYSEGFTLIARILHKIVSNTV